MHPITIIPLQYSWLGARREIDIASVYAKSKAWKTTPKYWIESSRYSWYGVFHSHGGTPIAGWFMENPNRKCLIYIEVAPFQETSICFQMGMVHGRNETLLSPSCKNHQECGVSWTVGFLDSLCSDKPKLWLLETPMISFLYLVKKWKKCIVFMFGEIDGETWVYHNIA